MSLEVVKISSFTLDVPSFDISRLKGIAKAMGWTIHRQTPVEKSLEEIAEGKVYTYNSLDDFIKEIAEG